MVTPYTDWVADVTVTPRIPQRVTRTQRPTACVQNTCRGYLAYLVKSGILSASVAFGPIAVVTHWKNTTATDVPSVIWVGFENVGPNPLAATRAQMKRVRPKIGMTIVLVIKR